MRRIVVIFSAMFLATWGLAGTSSAKPVQSQGDFGTQATTTFSMNEVQTDGSGGARDSFVEIRNIAQDPLNLNGFRLAQCIGTGTIQVFHTISLAGDLPVDEFYVAADKVGGYSGPTAVIDEEVVLDIGRTDGVALLTPAVVGDIIVDAVSFGATTTVANDGCLEESVLQEGPATASPTSNSGNSAGARCSASVDTDRNAADFAQETRTPGAASTRSCT